MTMGTNDELQELEVEVEADIELDAAGTASEDDELDWALDPYEAQAETADLNSLHGAIEALEGDEPPYSPAGE
ncbi:hypothetical protein [Kribbella jiaozuonensis]|uniref:Uncharacterized protein n=1 Tax=Kribbella jiaozuonensis TaxID=2575441 RepID=A0A4U3LMT8_9ACTN|nr:hypothetical protein [Kribbella jiaozuonensis]TKK76469.1 hypothetical protein FDA38_29235 [Kribbella jiaozuonensis]